MPEIGTLGLMSGDGKRSAGHRPQATAPILDSTERPIVEEQEMRPQIGGGPEAEFRRDAVPWGTRRRRRLGKSQRLPYGTVQEEGTPAEGRRYRSAPANRKPDSEST